MEPVWTVHWVEQFLKSCFNLYSIHRLLQQMASQVAANVKRESCLFKRFICLLVTTRLAVNWTHVVDSVREVCRV